MTLGNFDGVHLGHVALVESAVRLARDLGGLPVLALALDPHPRTLLGQEVPAPLTTLEDRLELLLNSGATHAGLLRASPTLLSWDADTFFQKVLVEALGARGLVEGHNFCFGRGRGGTIETLRKLCPATGIRLGIVEAIAAEDGEVSSTRIRSALAEGAVEEALRLLGRPYRLRGRVVVGAQRGRTIGFPTANLEARTVVPGAGVYACLATTGDGKTRPAATHIGPSPTFGDAQARVEAHLLDYTGDLYGQEIALDFLHRIREPRRFASADELVGQLRLDIQATRDLTAETAPRKGR